MWVTILGILLGIAHFPNGVETAEVSAAFNCKNSLIADDWRKLVLNFHNERRRRVSAGEQPYKGGIMPSAKVMNELVGVSVPSIFPFLSTFITSTLFRSKFTDSPILLN
ncbi:hypothetical protein Y032_0005g2699 [Ancylostoma ceylanicum]|uniref:SCP domain-containing protein n=1 Tax=Ancylostoma ceylanicum TaxID=53326 RepID=A0A016VU44_9BILA|nr:hypothetical protein Y032_0005g2699 [Ancylostoma ceylanicum]